MDLARLRKRIKEIADSPKNVRFDELSNLLDNHIKPLFGDYNHHGNPHHAFTVGGQTFNISEPHRGNVKEVYVRKFLEAMEVVGLHEPEEER
jgi:hypothetical protein